MVLALFQTAHTLGHLSVEFALAKARQAVVVVESALYGALLEVVWLRLKEYAKDVLVPLYHVVQHLCHCVVAGLNGCILGFKRAVFAPCGVLCGGVEEREEQVAHHQHTPKGHHVEDGTAGRTTYAASAAFAGWVFFVYSAHS